MRKLGGKFHFARISEVRHIYILFLHVISTARQRSFGKIMFSYVSLHQPVILSTGWGGVWAGCDHYPSCTGPHCTGLSLPPGHQTCSPRTPGHQTWDPQLPASDIWWSFLETCSKLVHLKPPYSHQVATEARMVGKRVVCIPTGMLSCQQERMIYCFSCFVLQCLHI